MSENLLTFLDKHFEDETTKGWVLSSLSKLYTVPGINTGERIQEKFNKYTNSKYLDLQQRGIEYKYLSEFGSSSDIEYDSTLSFLDSYVDYAQKRGARPYDPDKKTRGLLSGLALHANTGSDGAELKVTPYSQEASKARANQSSGDSTGIKVQSTKWTTGGYVDTKHESHINKLPQSFSGNQSKSISSQDIQKGKMYPGIGQASSPTFTGGTTSAPSHSTFSRPQQEDSALKEMQKTATALFAGLGGPAKSGGTTAGTTSTTKPTTSTNPFGLPSKPSTTTTTTFGAGTGSKAPTTTTQKPQGANPFGLPTKTTTTTTNVKPTAPASDSNIDLLDLDFGGGTTQTTQPTQQTSTGTSAGNFDLLGGAFAGGFGGTSPMQQQQQQPSYTGKYTPVNLDLEFYEKYWNELPSETSENVQTSVKNVSDFKTLLNKINFGFVAEIEGEVLGAGKRANGDFVLIYARITPNGVLEVQSKSNSNSNAQEFIQHMKEAGKN